MSHSFFINFKFIRSLVAIGLVGAGLSACKPQTAGQKVENAAEDAAHETGQALERGKENVDRAVK